MNVKVLVSNMSEIPNPMAVPIHHVGDYKGFEIWKGDEGSRAHIYFRYTAFGQPVITEHIGSQCNVLCQVKRLMVYFTPFTSVKAFKDFINNHVEGV